MHVSDAMGVTAPMTPVVPMDAGNTPPETPATETLHQEGQALAEEMIDPEVWNDPDAVATLFEENATQLEDPDFAAGFIEGFPADALRSVAKEGYFPYASDEQNAAFLEQFSEALGAASHSDQLSTEWQDAFFAGIDGYPSTVDGVGALMRHGEFSTDFLMRGMREVIDLQDGAASLGAGQVLEAVARNPEAAALSSAAFADRLVNGPEFFPSWQVAQVFESGAVTHRSEDPAMAEYAARQIIDVVDAKDGKMLFGMDDAMAAIATEYFADIAYAANSPVDIPLDQQDPLRDGIEMPFEAAHDLLYAAGGASPDALAELMVAAGEWQEGLMQSYGGSANLSSAYGRELGAMQAMLSGSIGERLIADGKSADADNAAAREGLGILLNAIETKGTSLSGVAKTAVKDLITDTLLPRSNEEAQARADYVNGVADQRRDAFRDAANYLLVQPANLDAFNLGQNPPVEVDISPATTIAQYESDLQSQYASQGYPIISVDADFTVDNGNGGLEIMSIDDMSSHQRAAYVQWVSTPEVQQVLLQQVTAQNQAQDDVPFGMNV
ncbi:hypothetical protein [Luteimonas abyssi]|uniref:hypothetical protein n=1 Tax=Luteimonas abyssi TaxID=1247514 RepID=UPI000737CC7C|nr:hypothetical protein [Luteimonas abyssi]